MMAQTVLNVITDPQRECEELENIRQKFLEERAT